MKKKLVLLFFAFVAIFLFSLVEAIAQKDGLPERYEKWLQEEVGYIIAPLEKEVFLQLSTDRERDLFMKAFWKQRDPTSGTPKNEFKEEHYRRVNYSNHFFGRTVPGPGWRTERGRIYIILGEPGTIERFTGKSTIYPTEVWFYQDMTKFGLPAGFNLVFFQQGAIGDYKLYSPLRDGPQALIAGHFGDQMDYRAAYEQLRELEPSLAGVSLSLVPGEGSTAMGRPTLASDILLQKVDQTAVRLIKEKYAEKFLEYKDIVEVEYSTNYISSDTLVKVIKDPSGLYFVHFAIEPERLSVDFFQDKYYTTMKVNGTVSNMEGKIIHQFERDLLIEFDQEQIGQISSRPFSICDMFPLIPGSYKMSILVKNEISKEFTSLERDLLIPGEEELQMTSLILGYRMTENVPPQNRLRPFQMGKNQISVQTNRVFLREDDLVVCFQIHGLTPEQKENGEIKYTFFKSGEGFQTVTKRINDYIAFPSFVEKFPLQEFFPAHYRVQVSLWIDGREILFDSDEFDITHQETVPRAWVHRRLLPSSDNPIYTYTTGIQTLNSGKIEEARISLEKAYRSKPNSVGYAISLAQACFLQKDYSKVESILLPFLNLPQPPDYQVYFLMGKTYQNLGKYSKAIEVFDNTISHYGLNISILNSLGECYFQLGKMNEALAAWEKSLEINPEQPQIKKRIEAVKEIK